MADMLKDRLDWQRIMVQPRYAGGHEEVMKVLFKDAEVIARYIEDDYQGAEGFVYRLKDTGEIVVVSDSFGSCSGCDSWEGATDEEARRLCIELANNAHVFASIEEAIRFLGESVPEDKGAYWDLHEVAPFLAAELRKCLTAAEGGDAHGSDAKLQPVDPGPMNLARVGRPAWKAGEEATTVEGKAEGPAGGGRAMVSRQADRWA